MVIGYCVALVLLSGRSARAAEPAQGPVVLAKGISEAFLVGFDDRYVYWIEEAAGSGGAAGKSIHRLRRVGKQGGTAETVTGAAR